MDKKTRTRILIVIVASLWAYNIYRTIENYQVKTQSQEESQSAPLSFAPIMFNKDTFNLELPNQDPFLRGQQKWNPQNNGTIAVNNSNANRNQNTRQNQPVITTPATTKWPTVKYFGFLRNHQANHKLCMLNIEGKNYRLSIGETKANITVVEAFPDSIQLVFNNSQKTIQK